MIRSHSGENDDQIDGSTDPDVSDNAVAGAQVLPADMLRRRCRIWFKKEGPLRYCSHLDLARVWERVLRRADLPLMYSQGFNPRPKLQLATGLPLGYSSLCEVLDVWLEGELPALSTLVPKLQQASPRGLTVDRVEAVDLRGPALQSLTRTATYRVVVGDNPFGEETLRARVKTILSQSQLPSERRGKYYDLRPLIHELDVLAGEPLTLRMMLSLSQAEGTGRPDEVLRALGLDPRDAAVTRTEITFDSP